MFRVRIKSTVCGHWWAAVVPGKGILALPYVRALRACPCPRCVTLAHAAEALEEARQALWGRPRGAGPVCRPFFRRAAA